MADANFQQHLEVVRQSFEQKIAGKEDLSSDQEKQILKEVIQEQFAIQREATQPLRQSDDDDQKVGQKEEPVKQPAVSVSEQDLRGQARRLAEDYIQLALNTTLERAVKEVNATNNPFVIDEFHDALVDRFYNEIKSKEK